MTADRLREHLIGCAYGDFQIKLLISTHTFFSRLFIHHCDVYRQPTHTQPAYLLLSLAALSTSYLRHLSRSLILSSLCFRPSHVGEADVSITAFKSSSGDFVTCLILKNRLVYSFFFFAVVRSQIPVASKMFWEQKKARCSPLNRSHCEVFTVTCCFCISHSHTFGCLHGMAIALQILQNCLLSKSFKLVLASNRTNDPITTSSLNSPQTPTRPGL